MENSYEPNKYQPEAKHNPHGLVYIVVFIFMLTAVVVALLFDGSTGIKGDDDSAGSKDEMSQIEKFLDKKDKDNGKDDSDEIVSGGESSNDTGEGAVSDANDFEDGETGSASYTEDYAVEVSKDITYATVDGMTLKIDIYTPKGVDAPTPAIMYIHGGGFKGGSKNGVADDAEMLAKHGIAAIAVDYRLSGTAEFPAQIHDVNGATRYVRANASKYNIDPNAIFSLGESAGGVLASLLGVTGSSLEGTVGGNTSYSSSVSGVINISGSYMASIVDTMSGGILNAISAVVDCTPVPSAACESQYEELSPETYIGTGDAPFIILHGDKDGSVPTVQAETMQDTLESKGISAELHVASDLGHVGGLLARYLDEVIAFVNRNS